MESAKNLSRALRRHHVHRLQRKRRTYWSNKACDWTPRLLNQVVANAAKCSCTSCGNARKWFGERTVQERRAMQAQHWTERDDV